MKPMQRKPTAPEITIGILEVTLNSTAMVGLASVYNTSLWCFRGQLLIKGNGTSGGMTENAGREKKMTERMTNEGCWTTCRIAIIHYQNKLIRL